MLFNGEYGYHDDYDDKGDDAFFGDDDAYEYHDESDFHDPYDSYDTYDDTYENDDYCDCGGCGDCDAHCYFYYADCSFDYDCAHDEYDGDGYDTMMARIISIVAHPRYDMHLNY